jgi:hypothetical protein
VLLGFDVEPDGIMKVRTICHPVWILYSTMRWILTDHCFARRYLIRPLHPFLIDFL